MRLLELHLDRFGCFTDRRLKFRPDAALTVIYGANEAGKSTALAGLSDVLYGIEARSPFDFLHRYPDMRLGATITAEDGRHLAFRRRKGNQNTLLDADEAPLPDDALSAWLGSVDRALFLDAFGLNRARLREGAKRLIDGAGKVGETLLAAAPGLSSLIALRASLAAEADQLFPAGRKVASRPFYLACERHSDARKRVRLESLQVETVRQAYAEREEARRVVDDLRQEQRKLREEASRLARLKAALPRLRRIDDLKAARQSLGIMPDVAEDFPARCRTALDARRALAAEAQRLEQEISEPKEELATLGVDDALLDEADVVDRLAEQRGGIVKANEDLPKLEGRLAAVHQELDGVARRLGLDDHVVLLARRPPDTAVARARSLLNERRRQRDRRKDCREALAGVVAELDKLARRREALGHVADPTPLRRQLDGLAVLLERMTARDELARSLEARQTELDDHLRRLVVPVGSADDLARLAVPDPASVEQAIERFDGIERRRGEHQSERQRLVSQATSVERRIGELKADGEVPTARALSEARGERDILWKGLRPRLLDDVLSPAAPDDVANYEATVARADHLADRRQAEADRIAEDRALHSDLCQLKHDLAAVEQGLADLDAQSKQCQTDWSELWSPSQVTPKTPREMRGWLQAAEKLLHLRSELGEDRRRLADADAKLTDMLARLHKLTRGLGMEAVGHPAELLDRTAAAVSVVEKSFQDARVIAEKREDCEGRRREIQTSVDELDGQEVAWRSQWSEAAGAVGLREEVVDEEGEAALSAWQAVPALEASMKDLEHRIARIKQDQHAFEQAAAKLCAAVAPDLGEPDPVAVSARLRTRLVEARQAATSRSGLRATLAGLEDKAEACRRDVQLNDGALAELCTAAGTDRDELGALAGKIEQGASLAVQLAGERKALLDAADGRGETDLRSELAGHDHDSLTARLQELGEAEEALAAQLDEAISIQTLAAKKLSDIEARAGAADAAQDEQNALAEVAGIIETWTGLAAAEKLLSAAIEAYRAQNRNPLLDRASEAFAIATGNAFSGIALDYDDGDSHRIVALRPDGGRLAIDALSEGTADQLFLALRIATIEDHARRARPLPFVADDLFVTFDDTRTKAGLTLLAELGRTTQTIVFTHHQHVVEAARHVLGDRVETIDLG